MKKHFLIFILLALLVVSAFTSARAASALSMPTGSNNGIADTLNTEFADTPAMIEIAKCESGERQFDSQGNPLIGGGKYVGIFQISESHIADAQSRGIDIYTTEGNIAYAKYLYQQSGTAPWRGCVKTVSSPIPAAPNPAASTGTSPPTMIVPKDSSANPPVATTPNLNIAQHPIGTNILSNETVYYISQTGLVPYSASAVFESYGFNSWSSIVQANAEDLKLPVLPQFMNYADGTLVQDSGTVYIMSNGKKYGITSAQVFLDLGYSWGSVVRGDTSFVPNAAPLEQNSAGSAHLQGTLLNSNGTIYYSAAGGKLAFASMDVFNSWGFRLENVVNANQFDFGNDLNNTGGVISGVPLISNWTLGKLSPSI